MATRAGWRRDLGLARRALLDDLAAFRAARGGGVIAVVFDGAAEDFFPDAAMYRGVQVFYARKGADADARIKEFVEASRERRTLHVVTSDRALGSYVRSCGAGVTGCQDFRAQLNEALARRKQSLSNDSARAVSSEVKPDKVDEWLRYFGVDANE